MSYEKFYKRYGINTITDFVKPTIIKASTFVFPKDAAFYWFKCSEGVERLSSQYPYLNKTNRAKVITIVKYADNAEGKFELHLDDQVPELMNSIIKKEKKYEFLKPDKIILADKDILIFNYGLLNYIYEYKYNTLNRLYKFNNTFNRMLMDMQVIKTRQRYILMDVPEKLPSFQELESMSASISIDRINKLPNNKYLMLIELWKFISPKYKHESLLNKIKTDRLASTTLVLTVDNRMVLLDLNFLYRLIEDYKDSKYDVTTEQMISDSYLATEKIEYPKTITSEQVKKLLYILLYQLKNALAFDFSKVNYENNMDNLTQKDLEKEAKNINGFNIKDILTDIQEDDENIINLAEFDSDEFDSDEYDMSTLDIKDAILKANLDKKFDNMEELMKARPIDELKIKMANEIESMYNNKVISKTLYKKYMEALEKQEDIENPYIRSANDPIQTLGDVFDYDKDDLEITDNDTKITFDPVLLKEEYSHDTLGAMNRKYLEEKYHKDIVRAVCGIRNNNNVILNYDIEIEEDITGAVEIHKIEVLNINGKKFTLKMRLPIINEDGTYTIGGSTYLLRKQRVEKPISKTEACRVILSSYYGKLFIRKAERRDNVGVWFSKTLNKQASKDNNIRNIILDSSAVPDVDLPLLYCQIAREVRSFNYGDAMFTFDYKNRGNIANKRNEEIVDLEKSDMVMCGVLTNGNMIFLDKTNTLLEYTDKGFKELGNFFSVINMDDSDMPIEYAMIKLLKVDMPIVFLLSYYLGLEQLLKILKVKYEILDKGKRLPSGKDVYGVKFKDCTLVLYKDNGIGDMILSGLVPFNKMLKELNYKFFNNKVEFNIVLNTMFLDLGSNAVYVNEIKLLETMFIDPITVSVLRTIKEPESFPALLIRAAEMLLDDKFKHPNALTEMVVKGYERIAGMVYNNIVKAMKKYENASVFSKASFALDEYEVLRTLHADNSKVTIDDLNPVAFIKQKEDLTLLGIGGRDKLTLKDKSTREMHPTEIGFVSEATKDSTNVGITAYMSANPKFTNLNGTVEDVKEGELGWGNILSSTGMLTPFGMHDDTKRLNFSSIHAAHVVPMINMRVPCVITGYEILVANKAGGKFATVAEDEGEVISVSKSEIKVQYKTKGVKSYRLYSWTTKEESGSCYTHNIVANLKEKQKFLKDDILAYDELFFEPCIFNPRRVLYKQGNMCRVMLAEDQQTYEDSVAISKELHTELATKNTYVKHFLLNNTDEVYNVININDKVNPDTPLLTISTSGVDGDYDEETLTILSDISNASPKAKYKGVVNRIEVYYNFDPKEATKSVQKLIEYSDSVLKKRYGQTGRVTNFAVKAKPLLPGEMDLRIYIESDTNMGAGDKMILGSQLKCTVGEVFEYDIETEDGQKIDAIFSNTSISARIVNSPNLLGTTGALVDKIEKTILDMYFK